MAAATARAIRKAAESPIMVIPKRFVFCRVRPPLLFNSRCLYQPSPLSASSFAPIRCWSRFQTSGPVAERGDDGRWVILMKRPGGKRSTVFDMIDAYIDTLAKVVGSEEEAFAKIYKVSCQGHYGFGCKIDEGTSNKLKGLPGVLDVFPDCNHNHCGGEDRDMSGTSIQSIKWHARSDE